jgi:hypothetical protein
MNQQIVATLWMRNPVLDVLKAAEELAEKSPVAEQFAEALDAARSQKLWTSLPVTRELVEYARDRAPEIREALAAEAESADDKDVRAAAKKMLALFDGYVRWTADALGQIERKQQLLASLDEVEPIAPVVGPVVDEEPSSDSPAASSKRGRRKAAAAA